MKKLCLTVLVNLAVPAIVLLPAAEQGGPPAFNRVRFYPAPGREVVLVGGKFSGSNLSPVTGFKVLAEIKAAPPAGQWTELSFPNDQVYRYIRYEAPAGSHGNVAELEFYAGKMKLTGSGFGTTGGWRTWQKALDGDTNTWFDSNNADGQHVGIDLGEKVAAAKPTLEPAPGFHKGPVKVVLKCGSAGASIRYTLDGTTPSPATGTSYTAPIAIDKTTTLVAVAFKDGLAPSPLAAGIYHVGAEIKPGFTTFHIGNSLTNTTGQFAAYAKGAGYQHEYRSFTSGGALTVGLWDMATKGRKQEWQQMLDRLLKIDHFTCQPRDFDIAREAENDVRFFNVIRQKSPEFQPWLYIEWVEKNRQRPSDKGTVPSSQMKTLFPALTWEESMGAMLLYGEELQRKLGETYKEGKRPRIIPSCLAMGWVKNMIDHGKLPGAAAGSFYPLLYSDDVHPNANGAYLVDMTWFAALYRQSPEGMVLPLAPGLTPEQAGTMQRLAWDTIKNYPDCGLYEEGKTPAGKPEFSPAPSAIKEVTSVTLSSSTPGAWFRYTLDGTAPTRTTGYVYCGVVSARPGMTVKAVAYKSGMADSPVAEATFR
ncbi:hypothetical protein AYO40_03135 [Planctomycetaceae bacterium SCGC AG-212-D15]|nr:hypothetical protein AYO40_03135 [Planctomycetaceae bacterium SCGC AG-212-D15]